jgi:alanine dehydrogenase
MALSLGLPRMHKEAGERRDFLPDLVASVSRLGGAVCVEEGIGAGMGITEESYLARSPALSVTDNDTAWRQDVVLVLRSPEVEEYAALLRPGTILVSMLHFPTRPRRIAKLKELGCDAVSLDSLVDDGGRRLVENTRAVGWNGLEAAFEALERTQPARLTPDSPPLRVMVMGAGQVGRHAVEAAIKYGSIERFADWSKRGVPAVEVSVVGRGLTGDERYMRDRFAGIDILVDASQRSDPSRPLIPNEWIGWLPAHAVVCDLVVDPYVPSGVPPTVRSIEGIPSGDLDQWIFLPEDARWSDTMPGAVPRTERRPTATCYSWPGIHAEDCMRHYGRQLRALLERILAGGVADLHDGDFLDRALLRASLRSWSAVDQRGG